MSSTEVGDEGGTAGGGEVGGKPGVSEALADAVAVPATGGEADRSVAALLREHRFGTEQHGPVVDGQAAQLPPQRPLLAAQQRFSTDEVPLRHPDRERQAGLVR